jgi:hypothetical protein
MTSRLAMGAGERLFLTPGSHGEVAEMTGAHTKAGQLRNLRQNGTRHTINAAGWPVVPMSAVDGTKDTTGAERPRWKSNATKKAA